MIIVYASVINKLLLPNEENHEQAETLLVKHLRKINQIIVPELLLYEVANTLVTKAGIVPSKIKSNLKDLKDMNFLIEYISFQLINKAAILAKKYRVSVYDAIYAVLAKEKKCNLITADNKFARQINLSYVKTLDQYED